MRPKVKAECLRLMVTLRLEPAKTRLISKFIDTYLKLNPTEEKTFQSELDKLEPSDKEAIMQAETSWEIRGRQKEREEIAINMLRENLSLEIVAKITKLTIAELQQLQATQASS